MLLKILIIFSALFNLISSQISENEASSIWGSSTEDTFKDNYAELFEGFDDSSEPLTDEELLQSLANVTVEGCECVPYYICGTSLQKKSKRIKDKTDSPKPVECPHYLLKCCDDEDDGQPPLKDCGYRNPEYSKPKDPITNFGEFPWVVAIFYSNSMNEVTQVCGGSLIHPKVVLTAAHCLKNHKNQLKIRAGEWNFLNTDEQYPHQDREISSTKIHPFYSYSSLYNDIALLFLKEPVALEPHINTLCLPAADAAVDGENCISNGWGRRSADKGGILTKVELSLIAKRPCQRLLRKTRLGPAFHLHESFLCAGDKAGEDTCMGDGGGALACPIRGQDGRYQQTGIISWGAECKNGAPGVYTKVALFKNWIVESLKKENIDIDVY